MEEFRSIRCRTCDGVAHPASGCEYAPGFVVCGPCVRETWAWIVEHTASKGRRRGRPSFYDHVNRIAPAVQLNNELR